MSKRKLRRQLGLLQVVMLGTAGTIAASIFVLTGHAAGMAGPAAVLAVLVGGLLSYSVALNLSEMGAAFPVAGGAMSYVREAYGSGILAYLVGTMACLSSTFFAALSAVGFAYSLRVLIPGAPIVPVAIAVILLFTFINIWGGAKAGAAQIVLGVFLLLAFTIYVLVGFLHPNGFSWQTFVPQGRFFIHDGLWTNAARMLGVIALTYSLYVGFEVIVDDAEEISNYGRTIPRGILISLSITIVLYVLVTLVTQGTIPWQQLAESTTPLTDAVQRFMPGIGLPLMSVVGLIATLTSVNSAMLSASRQAFTMGRDGAWPRIFSKLSRFRTPVVSILIIGVISAAISTIGLVDLLSYITSAGYLFVLFWSSLAMIRLRRKFPDVERPFKVPLFPLSAYLAAGTCLMIVSFSDLRALLFGAVILAFFVLLRYIGPPLSNRLAARFKALRRTDDLILVAASNPKTVRSLVHLASTIASASEDTYTCIITVQSVAAQNRLKYGHSSVANLRSPRQLVIEQALTEARAFNLAMYTKDITAPTVAQGLLDEIERRTNVKLVLTGWPGPLTPETLVKNPVNIIIKKAPTNVGVLLDRGLTTIRQILVPIGGGPHSRLAIRLAYEIAAVEGARITALRLLTPPDQVSDAEEAEHLEDKTQWLTEIIEEELGCGIPDLFTLQLKETGTITEGIIEEVRSQPYDLIVMGASEEWALNTRLFGSVDDWIADNAPCSVLLSRRHEPATIAWLRLRMKSMSGEYECNTNGVTAASMNGGRQTT
ncbi:MAG: amino acid permease [Anaerolineae bacterium]